VHSIAPSALCNAMLHSTAVHATTSQQSDINTHETPTTHLRLRLLEASFPNSAMSQIVRYLTLLVLLLKIRLNSSASMLRMESLTALESSMHATGSNITSFATLTGSLLTGYQTDIYYTDAKCSIVGYAESYPLNVCYPWISGTSFYATFNGTHAAYTGYSDYSCTIPRSSYLNYYPIRACDDYSSTSVTASYPTIVSSSALLTAA
jgi:hypothetical protein